VARAAVRAAGLFYRSVVIVGRDLSEPMPEVEGMLPVEIRLLEEGDLDALRRHRADLDPARLADRIQRLGHGHACVAAWLDGEIVASVWIAFEGARVPEIDRRIRLRAGEAFLYDSYTSERARGHGIATVRAVWTATYLRDAGYRLGIGHLVPENRPAHGPPARAGYRVLGTAGYVRIGPWRRDFVRSAGGRRRWASKRPIGVAELEAAPAAEGVPATP
jgi:GNAT superfamily N-acetyltransferase